MTPLSTSMPISPDTLPPEVLRIVMAHTFVSMKELNVGRLISKLFRKMIDNEVEGIRPFYSTEMMALKARFLKVIVYEKEFGKFMALDRDRLNKNKAHSKAKDTFQEQTCSLWSRLIKKICIDPQSSLIKTIARIVSYLFSSVRAETEKQNLLLNNLMDLEMQKNEAEAKYKSFQLPECQTLVRFDTDYKWAQKRADTYQKIMDLFDGEEKFNTIPILDISTRSAQGGYIDFIKPDDMEAALMRGKDASGRLFFSIKREGLCQTFFQRSSADTTTWADGAYSSHIISCDGYWIDQGNFQEPVYNQIKDIISEAMQTLPTAQ